MTDFYREIAAVTEFLVGCLQEKVEGICEEDVSPVEKVLLTDQAVVVIRVLVAVTKDHLGTLSDDLTASLVELVDGVMQHPSLPLDLRSNAGIIYVAAKKARRISPFNAYILFTLSRHFTK